MEGEWAVHPYVGMGLYAGIGGGRSSIFVLLGILNPVVVVPVGGLVNFHFYQLIADKTGVGKEMESDKLDIYAGLNFGSGLMLDVGSTVTPLAIITFGPQVGTRYYFTPATAIHAEAGFGKNWLKAGFTFKL